jgi:hypothetical protein
MGCDQVRELAPELALDIATGEGRDAALRHLTECAGCRRLVSELSSLGEELLFLAPAHEPPPGFEARVLEALAEPAPSAPMPIVRPSRRRRLLSAVAVAAAVVLSMALGGVSAFLATGDERRLAESYRSVLDQGRGSFFAATPVEGTAGRVGTVFGYQGDPSWILVTMASSAQQGTYVVEAVAYDGSRLDLGEMPLSDDQRVWATRLPVDLTVVNEILLRGPDGATLTVPFGEMSPWD